MEIRDRSTAALSTALAALAFAALPAQAQEAVSVIPEQAEEQTLTADLVGQSIYSRTPDSEDLEAVGTIESLLLNENDRLSGVVVSFGGFMGFGAKQIALDWEALEIEWFGPIDFVAVVDMTPGEFEAAPEFKTLAQKEAERARQEMEAASGQPAAGDGMAAPAGDAGAVTQ